MASELFRLKEKILSQIPDGELPWHILGRISLKTGFTISSIRSDTPDDPVKISKLKKAAEEIFGKDASLS